MASIIDAEHIEDIAGAILVLRGHKVLLDAELATLYGVTTKRLNEQVKRNRDRFPDDFLFRLTQEETEAVNRSQIARFAEASRPAISAVCLHGAWSNHGRHCGEQPACS
jgi:hypothetical protein